MQHLHDIWTGTRVEGLERYWPSTNGINIDRHLGWHGWIGQEGLFPCSITQWIFFPVSALLHHNSILVPCLFKILQHDQWRSNSLMKHIHSLWSSQPPAQLMNHLFSRMEQKFVIIWHRWSAARVGSKVGAKVNLHGSEITHNLLERSCVRLLVGDCSRTTKCLVNWEARGPCEGAWWFGVGLSRRPGVSDLSTCKWSPTHFVHLWSHQDGVLHP